MQATHVPAALQPHSGLGLSFQSYFLNVKTQALIAFRAGPESAVCWPSGPWLGPGTLRDGEDSKKQSVRTDGL